MKKSWFIAIIILIILILLGIGVYLFFPSQSKGDGAQTTDRGSLFGNLDDSGVPIAATSTNTNSSGSNTDTPSNVDENVSSNPRFVARKIGDYPVSSVQPLDFKTGTTSTSTLLVSVGKDGGVIRMYDPKSKETFILGNISVPNIIASGFTKNATYVLVQSQDGDTLKTIILQSTSARNITEERFYSPIFTSTDVDTFFIGNNVFYFFEKGRSGNVLYSYDPAQKKKVLLYRGYISNLYGYARNGRIFFATKPAPNLDGFVFELDAKNGVVKTLTYGKGLSAIPAQSGDTLLTTTFSQSQIISSIFNIKNLSNTTLSVDVWHDKCTPDLSSKSFMFCGGVQSVGTSILPQDWYLGKVSTNDALYLIDTNSNSADILTTTDEQVDVIDPQSSAYSGILTFINKKDFAPWVVLVE